MDYDEKIEDVRSGGVGGEVVCRRPEAQVAMANVEDGRKGGAVLQRRSDWLHVLFEYLAVPPHPRPAPLGVNGGIGLERHTLPSEFDNNPRDISCVLCARIAQHRRYNSRGSHDRRWDEEYDQRTGGISLKINNKRTSMPQCWRPSNAPKPRSWS